MNEVTLGQRSFLLTKITKVIAVEDKEALFKALEYINYGNYKYLLLLCYTGKVAELEKEAKSWVERIRLYDGSK